MGRLEIFVDGEWRGICSNNFKASSGADVACRQIGYVGAEEVYEDGRYFICIHIKCICTYIIIINNILK